MNKWYEVKVTRVESHLVEVRDDGSEDPERFVAEEIFFDFDEIKSAPIDEGDLETYKRHADKDKIWPLEEY